MFVDVFVDVWMCVGISVDARGGACVDVGMRVCVDVMWVDVCVDVCKSLGRLRIADRVDVQRMSSASFECAGRPWVHTSFATV